VKKGYVKISNDVYTKDWDFISGVFKYFRPTHIEFRHWENDIWYIYGESLLFKDLAEGEEVPLYNIVMTSHADGTATFKFILDEVITVSL
jgi:hypothetical protein